MVGGTMERTDVNPWEWSKAFGFSQAVSVSGPAQLLFCSGQTAIGPDGAPPATPDMREQLEVALGNLGAVLESAGMSAADVVRLTIFTTAMDELLGCYASLTAFLAPNLPAVTLIGVSRLAYPELKVELEASAARS
jgi:enamine deaminase RidA (YjgF/YER057c/UK114 family)